MDRASVFETEGCGFDPRPPRHFSVEIERKVSSEALAKEDIAYGLRAAATAKALADRSHGTASLRPRREPKVGSAESTPDNHSDFTSELEQSLDGRHDDPLDAVSIVWSIIGKKPQQLVLA